MLAFILAPCKSSSLCVCVCSCSVSSPVWDCALVSRVFCLLINVFASCSMYWYDDKETRTVYGCLVEFDPIPTCMFLMFDGKQPIGNPMIVVREQFPASFDVNRDLFLFALRCTCALACFGLELLMMTLTCLCMFRQEFMKETAGDLRCDSVCSLLNTLHR
jgi:hypothetical protein